MRSVNIHMTERESFEMSKQRIQVRHYSKKMVIMMLTGAICCSSFFCEAAFAKTSKVRVYDVEKGTTSFTSFTYSDSKKDESLAPSEGTGAISSASQKVVIFNLGVNDLSSHNFGNGVDYKGEVNAYLAYMNTLAEELESNCRLFYMSVNSVNTAMKPTRKEAQLRYFNDRLQSGLNNGFQWIDTYKYLMENGYSTYNEFKGNIDDGVQYSTRTYKRIYKYCIKAIRK